MSAEINNFEKSIQEYITSSSKQIGEAESKKESLKKIGEANSEKESLKKEKTVAKSLSVIKYYDFYKNRQECIRWFEDFLSMAIANREFCTKLNKDSINQRVFESIKKLQLNFDHLCDAINTFDVSLRSKNDDAYVIWYYICDELYKRLRFCKDINIIKKKGVGAHVATLLNQCKKLNKQPKIDEELKNEMLKWAKEIFDKLKSVGSNCGETIDELLSAIDVFLDKNKKEFQLIGVAEPTKLTKPYDELDELDKTKEIMGNILNALT